MKRKMNKRASLPPTMTTTTTPSKANWIHGLTKIKWAHICCTEWWPENVISFIFILPGRFSCIAPKLRWNLKMWNQRVLRSYVNAFLNFLRYLCHFVSFNAFWLSPAKAYPTIRIIVICILYLFENYFQWNRLDA